MLHTRAEIISRTKKEFNLLDRLVSSLTEEQWSLPLGRPEGKDPWTIKDALAHITFWKAEVIRVVHGDRHAPVATGLNITDGNHVVYLQWVDKSPQEVLAWHRQVQADLLTALKQAPEEWFSKKERKPDWPYDLDGHSTYHRVKDIEKALKA